MIYLDDKMTESHSCMGDNNTEQITIKSVMPLLLLPCSDMFFFFFQFYLFRTMIINITDKSSYIDDN